MAQLMRSHGARVTDAKRSGVELRILAERHELWLRTQMTEASLRSCTAARLERQSALAGWLWLITQAITALCLAAVSVAATISLLADGMQFGRVSLAVLAARLAGTVGRFWPSDAS
jgi:hypothetical protein